MEKEKTKKETEEVVMTGKEVLSDEMLEEVAGGRKPSIRERILTACFNDCKNLGKSAEECNKECNRFF